jgi:predicted Zn-dependent peptidase
MEDLDAASIDDVADFFRTFYAPNNAVLSICGDFSAANARAMVERYFGAIPSGPALPPLPGRSDIPLRIGREIRETARQSVALPRIYLAFRTPPYGAEEFYAGDVLSRVLSGGKSSRLYRTLVRESRLAKDVAAFSLPVVTGATMQVIVATAAAGTEPERLEAALLAEVQAVREATELPAEIARALTGIESRRIFSLQQVGERADDLSMFSTLFDEPERINTELDRYRAVTAERVRGFAVDFLHEENRVVLTYLPLVPKAAA